jgi:hypothetical protein
MREFGSWWLVAFCAALVACGEIHGKSNVDDGGVGSDDGASVACTASATLRCEANTLVSCNADGTAEVQRACGLRCDPTALACEDKVDPSNGFAAELDGAATEPSVNITANTNVDMDNGFNAANGTLAVGTLQVKAVLVGGTGGAPSVIVISVGGLSVAASSTLTFGGQPGAPAIAIMSAGDVSIDGTLVVINAGSMTGNDPCMGASTAAAGADNDNPGGGGGGFAQPGGVGGAVLLVANGGAGGANSGTAPLIPLRGGCSGGKNPFGGLGVGGGAIQITSGTRIVVAGAIGANGLGGAVSTGGGSGGGILLEAPAVSLTGGAYANGGGGGCGSFSGSVGANGDLSTTPALGDICTNGVHGGSGGAGTTAPTNGGTKTNTAGTTDYAGGGGGAVGRIRINTLDMTITGSGAQSPSASLGTIVGR